MRPVVLFVLSVVPVRIGLDLVANAALGPVSLGQLGHGLLLAGLAAVALSGGLRAIAAAPAGGWLALFTASVAFGALRADSVHDAARYGLHLLTPVVWLLALHAVGRELPREAPRAWWAAAAVPVSLSLALLVAGQPAAHVLHGWPRLVGPYANLHSHAQAMAVFAAAGWLELRPRARPAAAAVTVGATIALAFTFVRTGWLWVAGAAFAYLLARGRIRGASALALAGLVAAVALPVVRDRFADVWAVASATPPPDGWGALGSWRGRIWSESVASWLHGPPLDVWLGRGLGGHFGLHRHLDVHSDWLAVLLQLGPVGLVAWLGLQGTLLGRLAARARADRLSAGAFALLLAATLLAAVSNDWLTRGTPLLWTYGWVGLALRPASGAGDAPPPRSSA